MREVVVAGAVRTPIGRFGGGLAAPDRGRSSARPPRARRCAARASPPSQVDEAIFGCARQAGGGPERRPPGGLPRRACPRRCPAFTVNMACGSGLKAIDLAFRAVRDGDADVVLAGGTESMSRVPYLLHGRALGLPHGPPAGSWTRMYQDGFLCPLSEQLMGETAETLADDVPDHARGAGRLRAAQPAARGRGLGTAGRFDAEIVPVEVAGQEGRDGGSRATSTRAPDTTLASLREAAAGLQARGRHRHRRQLVGHHRRRGGHGGAVRGARAGAGRAAAWRASSASPPRASTRSVMGIGVVPAVRRLLERSALAPRRLRPRRAQRGLRRPGARLRPRAAASTPSA